MESSLITLVDSLLDNLQTKGGGDLIEDFASAIRVEEIGNLLDVPHVTEPRCAAGRWLFWGR